MSRLKYKHALITGAAQGIGAAIARRFIEEGATVYLSDIQDEKGQKLAMDLGERAHYAHLDVRSEPEWESLLSRIAPIDILVNNAAITGFDPSNPKPQDPEHAALDDWRSVHETNLIGTFLGCKHAIRAMRANARPASIINIGSRSGVVGIPRAAAYASSKGAVRNHTKTVALYCAEEGLDIRCNCIQPAAVLTPMWDPMLGNGADRQANITKLAADCPLKRFADPREVAHLALYLAGDESAFTTGAEFNIDGGMLAGTAQTSN